MLDGLRRDGLQLVILGRVVLLSHDPLRQGHQHLQRVHLVRVQYLLRGVRSVSHPAMGLRDILAGHGNFFARDLNTSTGIPYVVYAKNKTNRLIVPLQEENN
jgi:hypothetical protein